MLRPSELLSQVVESAAGWTVAEKEGLIAAISAGLGAAAATTSAITARQNLGVAREAKDIAGEARDQSTRSATAGIRSAKYARKNFHLQRQSKDNPRNDSGYVSDSSTLSESSDSSDRQTKSKAKIAPKSRKQSTSQRLRDLERRFAALSKPLIDETTQQQMPHSRDKETQYTKKRTPRTIAYQANGIARDVATSDEHELYGVSEDSGSGTYGDAQNESRREHSLSGKVDSNVGESSKES